MLKVVIAPLALVGILTACSTAQEQAVVSSVQGAVGTATAALNAACTAGSAATASVAANPVVSGDAKVANLLGWLGGACTKAGATDAVIQAAVNDPNGIMNTVNWVNNLFNGIKAAVK